MKTFTIMLAFLLASIIAFSQEQVTIDDFKHLEGDWKGKIEFFDSRKALKDIAFQTELKCELKKNVLVFKFVYWDENGEYIKRTEKLELLENGIQVKDNAIWSVDQINRNNDKDELQLALKSISGKSEHIQMTKVITVNNKKLSIVKKQLADDTNVTENLYSFTFEKTFHKF